MICVNHYNQHNHVRVMVNMADPVIHADNGPYMLDRSVCPK